MCEKWKGHFAILYGIPPLQTNIPILVIKNEKRNFQEILESCFGHLVYNIKTPVCADHGHDSNNLAMDIAMTLIIWLESHESSYQVVHFGKTFFLPKVVVLQVYNFFLYCKYSDLTENLFFPELSVFVFLSI